MKTALQTFGQEESGAVTVDWVVLTAAVVGLVMIVLIPVVLSTDSATQGVADYVRNVTVGYYSD